MRCPYCSFNDTKVVDTRETESFTRRRRECLKCEKRFTTYERVEIDLVVIKKDKTRENFSREKLRAGILKACEKRPISTERIGKVVDDIEMELRRLKTNEIESKIIGNKVIKKLKGLDKVAYIRFASVYRSFADITDFENEFKKLVKKRE